MPGVALGGKGEILWVETPKDKFLLEETDSWP